MLWRERSPAIFTSGESGGSGEPAFNAVMIFFWYGQITIQTLSAIVVPKVAPPWM